jgi:hypothetical protein
MRAMHLIPLAVVLAGLLGCGGDKPGPAAAEFQAKLNDALSIYDAPQRDATLAKVAREAALAGHADMVKTALGKVGDRPARDATAEAAALSKGAPRASRTGCLRSHASGRGGPWGGG